MSEEKSKLQLIGEIAEANNKNLELIEEINKYEEVLDKIKEIVNSVVSNNEVIDQLRIIEVKKILKLLEEIE